jgi:hypothetical protein
MKLNLKPIFACATALLCTTVAHAGEKKLMHCFAWTSVKEATPVDWQAFFRASDALPGKIKGISKVWYGKLANPLGQTTIRKADPDTIKRLNAGEQASAEVARTPRDWGMCMEMRDADTLKAYDTDPYHKIWTDAYSKVRVEGTTTFNILGQ